MNPFLAAGGGGESEAAEAEGAGTETGPELSREKTKGDPDSPGSKT
jgi:hypothetical protein